MQMQQSSMLFHIFGASCVLNLELDLHKSKDINVNAVCNV